MVRTATPPGRVRIWPPLNRTFLLGRRTIVLVFFTRFVVVRTGDISREEALKVRLRGVLPA